MRGWSGGRREKRGREEREGRKKGREMKRGQFCAHAAPRREEGGKGREGGGEGRGGGGRGRGLPPVHPSKMYTLF